MSLLLAKSAGALLNTSLYAAPKALQDDQLLLLSDDLPTGFEIGVRSAKIAPGETVAIVDDSRPAIAEELGATMTINPTKLTMNSPGVDVAMECVGAPQTFDTSDLQLQDLWSKNITITTGLVSANATSRLLKLLQSGKMKPDQLITHCLQLSQIERVHDTFGNHSKEHTIKMYIETDNL
ncbi:hypothetical protein V1504DRAFT_489985 [Lipomyces starkeyi]